MNPTKTAIRFAVGAAVAVAALLGTTGCSLIAPQATLIEYDPAEGVGTELGEVYVRNAQAVANPDTGEISLVFTIINRTDERADINVAAGEGGADLTERVTVGARTTVNVGENRGTAIVIDDPTDAEIGSLYEVYFQAGDAEGVELEVPVLDDASRPYLTDLVP